MMVRSLDPKKKAPLLGESAVRSAIEEMKDDFFIEQEIKRAYVKDKHLNRCDPITGKSPAMCAAARGNVKALNWLLKYHFLHEARLDFVTPYDPVDKESKLEFSALTFAVSIADPQHLACAIVLIEKKTPIRDDDIHVAIRAGNTQFLEHCHKEKLHDIFAQGFEKPIQLAIQYKQTPVLECLFSHITAPRSLINIANATIRKLTQDFNAQDLEEIKITTAMIITIYKRVASSHLRLQFDKKLLHFVINTHQSDGLLNEIIENSIGKDRLISALALVIAETLGKNKEKAIALLNKLQEMVKDLPLNTKALVQRFIFFARSFVTGKQSEARPLFFSLQQSSKLTDEFLSAEFRSAILTNPLVTDTGEQAPVQRVRAFSSDTGLFSASAASGKESEQPGSEHREQKVTFCR